MYVPSEKSPSSLLPGSVENITSDVLTKRMVQPIVLASAARKRRMLARLRGCQRGRVTRDDVVVNVVV
jgi:hypothetical protein